MTARLVRSSFVSVLLLAAALVVFPGCDTSDPVPPVEPTEVAGVYRFVEFRFNPDPQFVPDAVVLDTLVADSTSIELLNSGQFQFRYRLRGGLDNIINGTFTVDRNEVTLSFESGFEARLRALLRLDVEGTLDLFDAFGRLPGERQRAFWSRETSAIGMAASMWGMFSRMPTRSRLELARATLGR